jgi:hypothetical protein
MSDRIPAEFELYMRDRNLEDPIDVREESPDVFSKFIEQAAVCAALPIGDRHIVSSAPVAKFDFADIDADAKIYAKRMAEEWNEEITNDSERLAKMETPGNRRRENLRGWLQGQLVLGKSARELIDHAGKYDAGVANVLREIAAEIKAA